ncbi:hypothetical protein BFJ71_g16773 [Fusarium oxysporum]|nr:hypothetical protein BFJ71_g16773 [Fusarium oxysporum]
MASADSSSVSVNDHDSLSFTEKPTENLDTAGEFPQASESSSISRQPSSKEPERNRHGEKIAYSHTAHNRVRGHLRDKHYIQISEQPTAKKLGQNNAIDRLFRLQASRQKGRDIEQEKHLLAAVDE